MSGREKKITLLSFSEQAAASCLLLCITLVISQNTCRKTAKPSLSNVPGKNILWFKALAQHTAQASASAATVRIFLAILEGGQGDQSHPEAGHV